MITGVSLDSLLRRNKLKIVQLPNHCRVKDLGIINSLFYDIFRDPLWDSMEVAGRLLFIYDRYSNTAYSIAATVDFWWKNGEFMNNIKESSYTPEWNISFLEEDLKHILQYVSGFEILINDVILKDQYELHVTSFHTHCKNMIENNPILKSMPSLEEKLNYELLNDYRGLEELSFKLKKPYVSSLLLHPKCHFMDKDCVIQYWIYEGQRGKRIVNIEPDLCIYGYEALVYSSDTKDIPIRSGDLSNGYSYEIHYYAAGI